MLTTKFEGFEGIALARHQEFSDQELLAYARSLSRQSGPLEQQLLHWDFGPIMHMHYQAEAANYLFSDECVPLHWDGAFFREPAALLFYCTETDGEGGDTIFSNTERLWEALSASEQAQCRQISLKYTTEKKAHYGGEIHVSLVQTHPISGKTILRLAERVETAKNPVTLEIFGVADAQGFYQSMVEKLYQPRFVYQHRWQKGDLLICDNFTYLHGRRALGSNRSRAFKRVQIL
ncbi:TauD/TfdA dioxygenase family protein [Parachitinimonas caeni]|uniref:TauD/TfdA family dioxygenase n=1 Tax=Parachitinimonas caeni TaxID=3031301 RepID=A0ABT7DZQ3_9NEIS|nr:TauD/TfdA family dioxygenase [Parachitinimonas caeni]MDK2125474.1 TauD/TfdA family dioxygenase [Parachitinimonas caeni]